MHKAFLYFHLVLLHFFAHILYLFCGFFFTFMDMLGICVELYALEYFQTIQCYQQNFMFLIIKNTYIL